MKLHTDLDSNKQVNQIFVIPPTNFMRIIRGQHQQDTMDHTELSHLEHVHPRHGIHMPLPPQLLLLGGCKAIAFL